ncbi:hypothetical protein [Candidatus Hecatella orcuttiae]|jgi:glutamate synthase domain-containing protein 3|uniref:GltB/FmdC/FwdC-like GXGXG domain-containing protein n=1 Tax=Candidatus Hecatella orcuttiae TaxID=1935119 RepID=UPI0028681868|nr:hypothetical protein [Candidatus Hecatella orcuttiae]
MVEHEKMKVEETTAVIDAQGLHHRVLNGLIKKAVFEGAKKLRILNVHGQRYIGAGLSHGVEVEIHGTPGGDLASFMGGSRITVYGNVEDGCGNTMAGGEVVVHGHAGDIVGYAMRGGRIFIRGCVGYRAAIHMKGFQERKPVLVVGGNAGDFLGEYMAGGVIVLLRLNGSGEREGKANFLGTGMHGGTIYLRGEISGLNNHVRSVEMNGEDLRLLRELVEKFSRHFGYDTDRILKDGFTKLIPAARRPYHEHYS